MCLYLGIVAEVKRRGSKLCRPVIFPNANEMPSAVVKLMEMCWNDTENERPTFKAIRSYIKKNIQEGG